MGITTMKFLSVTFKKVALTLHCELYCMVERPCTETTKERTATSRWRGVEIRGHCLPSKGQQCSELFCFFLELHAKGGAEYEQARDLPFFISCWVIFKIRMEEIQSATIKVGMVST